MKSYTRTAFLTSILGILGVSAASADEPVDFHARNIEAEHGLIGGYLRVTGAAQTASLHSDFLGAGNLNVQNTTNTYKLTVDEIQGTNANLSGVVNTREGRLVLPVGTDHWATGA